MPLQPSKLAPRTFTLCASQAELFVKWQCSSGHIPNCLWNRLFPSFPGPLYQNEVKCSAFDMEMFFYSHANKTHFHNNGCALGLILKARVFGTRKGPITYLHIRQSSQCAKECHGLAAAWWAAKNHGLMFSQPRVQECFMSHCVYCWHDNIRCCDFVSLHFNLRHLGLP